MQSFFSPAEAAIRSAIGPADFRALSRAHNVSEIAVEVIFENILENLPENLKNPVNYFRFVFSARVRGEANLFDWFEAEKFFLESEKISFDSWQFDDDPVRKILKTENILRLSDATEVAKMHKLSERQARNKIYAVQAKALKMRQNGKPETEIVAFLQISNPLLGRIRAPKKGGEK